MFWSFLTVDELLERDDSPSFKSLREVLSLCAEGAILDPTGLRSFLHNLRGCGGDARSASDAAFLPCLRPQPMTKPTLLWNIPIISEGWDTAHSRSTVPLLGFR